MQCRQQRLCQTGCTYPADIGPMDSDLRQPIRRCLPKLFRAIDLHVAAEMSVARSRMRRTDPTWYARAAMMPTMRPKYGEASVTVLR